MKKTIFFLIGCLSVVACTKDKTDYDAEIDRGVIEHFEFKEAVHSDNGAYAISVEALNGTFYRGYNEIRLRITDSKTKENVKASSVKLLPIMTNADGREVSCPHRFDLIYRPDNNYFSGYTVFTCESNTNGSWKLYINVTIDNQVHTKELSISVQEQSNKNLNMTSFTGKDGEQYIIALVAPQKPKIAENELVAGIYKFNRPTGLPARSFPDPSQFSYTEVNGYTLQLDPRMPEPSMGNHSSPNNKNLTQRDDGLYYGVVNYTMTGNWTLNFIMLNKNGKIIKGTEVPADFTPGVEGVKSELYIDILF